MESSLWERYAGSGYDLLVHLKPYRALLQETVQRARLRTGMTVLDAGCGTGNLLLALQEAGLRCQVTALDVTGPMLEQVRSKAAVYEEFGGRVRVVAADLSRDVDGWGVTGRFDRFICSHSLYALRHPARAVDGLATLGRAGSRLVAVNPGPAPAIEAILAEHVRMTAPRTVREALQELARIRAVLAPVVAPNEEALADPRHRFADAAVQVSWFQPPWYVSGITSTYAAQDYLIEAEWGQDDPGMAS